MKTLVMILALVMWNAGTEKTIYDFKINMLNSDEVLDFSQFAGKKIMIVNVASKCGFTPQYKELQALYEQYKGELVIVGFPCDQFMGQELNSETSIEEFCKANYGVSFPMTTMVNVKGKDQHPIYQWLTKKALNGKGDYEVSWNFNKFLIDENGKLIAHFPSKVTPYDDQIVSLLK